MANKKMSANGREPKSMLDEKRLALALGAGTAVSLGLMGLSVGAIRSMMGIGSTYNAYNMMGAGYSLPLAGLATAMVWGFVIGAVTGYLTAWVYNRA